MLNHLGEKVECMPGPRPPEIELSDAEHRDLLTLAGFTEVATKHVSGKNWICATGRRPT